MPPAPESRQVSAGQDVRLECEVAEAGEVVWLKGTERIQPSGRFQVLCRGQRQTLVIRGFSAEDQGEYRCGPTRDPASATATAFQGMLSRAQLVRGWRTEWGALDYGVGGWPSTARGPRGEPTSHQGRLRPSGEIHRSCVSQPHVRIHIAKILGHTLP